MTGLAFDEVRELLLTEELVRDLAVADAGPVFSVHLRTDPRDPANTNHAPGWQIALRNGLRAVEDEIEERGTREERLAFRETGPAIARDLAFLSAAARGRSVSYFAGPAGVLRIAHQLPLRDDTIRWDGRPYIGPLVELVERGRATGLVLVSGDAARLLHWEGGRVVEPERSQFTLELGDWRDYAGPAAADPARGQRTATHAESYQQRVDEWRRRWVKVLAAAIADRTRTVGWDRLLVAGAPEHTRELVQALPDEVAARVVGQADVNVIGLEAAAVAERLEATLAAVVEAEAAEAAEALARVAAAHAADLPAAVTRESVLHALVEQRVEHLLLDPAFRHAPEELGAPARRVLDGAPPELLSERAIESAVAAGARVTTLASPAFEAAGGMVARLRY